ncbi:unannotated protein [freshwater metagenome]|uniref:Unannotated protein n=1 Tax=freshwater metagenome TaxID=449393 RepID=A0A6J6NQR7_9ZZZZ
MLLEQGLEPIGISATTFACCKKRARFERLVHIGDIPAGEFFCGAHRASP